MHYYSTFQVNNNGGVSFGSYISSYTPEAFPLQDGSTFIAVFWSDVDTRYDQHGKVYFRETVDAAFLQELTTNIVNIYGERGLGFFEAKWAFVATWWEVTYFSGQSYADFLFLNKGEVRS